jgi:hypothetical protein
MTKISGLHIVALPRQCALVNIVPGQWTFPAKIYMQPLRTSGVLFSSNEKRGMVWQAKITIKPIHRSPVME